MEFHFKFYQMLLGIKMGRNKWLLDILIVKKCIFFFKWLHKNRVVSLSWSPFIQHLHYLISNPSLFLETTVYQLASSFSKVLCLLNQMDKVLNVYVFWQSYKRLTFVHFFLYYQQSDWSLVMRERRGLLECHVIMSSQSWSGKMVRSLLERKIVLVTLQYWSADKSIFI